MRLFRTRKNSQSIPSNETPLEPFLYPDGVCLITETNRYFISKGRKHKIASDAVFSSWQFPLTARSTEKALGKVPNSLRNLSFREGTVVIDSLTEERFLISGQKKRYINNESAFIFLNIDADTGIRISHEECLSIRDGGDMFE